MRHFLIPLTLIVLLLTACTRAAPNTAATPIGPATIANPSLPPAAIPVMTYLPPTRAPGTPISSPTANVPEILPTFTQPPADATQEALPTATSGPISYTVQGGDFPGSIAEKFNISVDDLLTANKMTTDSVIYPGDTLLIPGTVNTDQQQAPLLAAPSQVSSSDFFKIIPDSELVYGPLSSLLDLDTFVQQQGGYLAFFTQDVDGETLTGAQIINKVARNYSVNPRLLLAVLEYRSQWVTNPNPSSKSDTPIGYVDNFYVGFYRQMVWAANTMSGGFYDWRANKISDWKLADESTVIPQPGINPGTAGVQAMFARLDDNATWQIDTGPGGLYATYTDLFGYPFDLAVEPLLPPDLTQPTLALPFSANETWQFTGGPHEGWDSGSPWAALDFAPPGEPIGCGQTDAWATAVAPGLIIRASNGAVVEDLDGDGLEQTGWTILYMHMESRERVEAGQVVKVGDHIGHPSCEGGQANASHLHIARRYNGVWILANDPNVPFVMGGYTASSDGEEYGGWLKRGDTTIEAVDGRSPINQITP